MIRKWPIVCLVLIFNINFSIAQSHFSLQIIRPKEFALKTADLWNCVITNTGPTAHLQLHGVLTEKTKGKLYEVQSGAFDLAKGVTQFNTQNYEALKGEKVLFKNPSFEEHVYRTNTFPNGDYTICIKLINIFGRTEAEECIQHVVNKVTAVNLISPYNKDSVCVTNPVFVWTSFSQNLLQQKLIYGIKIYEILPHQSPQAAAQKNPALFKESYITQPTFLYPLSAIPFKIYTSYAWQIVVLNNGKEISQSPVWSFVYKPCFNLNSDVTSSEPTKKPSKDTSQQKKVFATLRYNSLSDEPGKLPVIITGNTLTIGINCFPKTEYLFYRIKNAEGTPTKEQEIAITQGINFVQIPIDPNMVQNEPYHLTMYDSYGLTKYLNFVKSSK